MIRSGAVSYKRVQRVKQQVEKSGCHILGAVLNMVNVSKSSYYNSYYYGDIKVGSLGKRCLKYKFFRGGMKEDEKE